MVIRGQKSEKNKRKNNLKKRYSALFYFFFFEFYLFMFEIYLLFIDWVNLHNGPRQKRLLSKSCQKELKITSQLRARSTLLDLKILTLESLPTVSFFDNFFLLCLEESTSLELHM